MIHIVDPQTHEILDYITLDSVIEDSHKLNLETYLQTYDAIVFGGGRYDKHLEKRNLVIIPDEDGTLQEFVLFEVDKYRDTEGRKTHFYAHASYLELKKANIIYPGKHESLTASQLGGIALNDTGWKIGQVEASGTRTIEIENHTNPYEFIKRIAREFEVELRFRVETDGQKITGRYVDMLERIGEWRGRQVEFGRDLDGIRRIEKQDIVTALLGLGPEDSDGNRLEVLVEDEEALQRWGRVDEHGNLHHLIEPYEIQSERTEMTEEEARQYTRTALDKRINTQVAYETTVVDLEEVPGMSNKKIRFGDTMRIKDTEFNPPLFLEARVYEMVRSLKHKAKKDIKLGDYIEYTEEEVDAVFNQLRNEIRRRLDKLAIITINSSAGNVFKNAQGTTELTARTFVSGSERDEDGTLYDYQWMRFDKDGNHDTNFYAEGKTITVKASDIDEKATYRVLVAYELEVINTAEITISNVFDGEDGEPGPPGPKGDKGDPGPQGPPGTSVESIVEYYLATDQSSGVTTDTPGWTTNMQQMTPQKRYLWNYERINFSDGAHQNTNPVIIGVYGDEGEEGRSIVDITEYYLATNASSGVTRSTSGWTTTMQVTTPEKKYLWNYEKITWNKAPLETYTEPVIIGVHGEQGPKGEDGKTFYTWIKYADTPTSGMSDSPEGKEYIGIAYNKETPTPSTNYADYTWSKFKGDQGVPGPPGEDGQPTYTWVKYADDEHGNGMSDSPDGKLYIGLAFNKTSPEESNNPADYTWSLMPQNIEIGGRNLITLSSVTRSGATVNGYVYTLTKTSSSGNPYVRIPHTLFENDTEYVITFKARKVSGNVYRLAGHSTLARHETVRLFIDGIEQTHKLSNGWSNVGTANFPNDNEVHRYEIRFKTVSDVASVSTPYWYIQPNRPQYDSDSFVLEIWDWQLERGNKATDWTPAPEDVQAEIENAQTTADGKNTIIPSATEPSTSGRKVGDAWFQTMPDGSLVIHDFNGVGWVKRQFGEQSLVANSITAAHIKSLAGLDVGDGQFVVDANGNVKFSGNLEGATGSFSGELSGSHITGGWISFYGESDTENYIAGTSSIGTFVRYEDETGIISSVRYEIDALNYTYFPGHEHSAIRDYFTFDMDDARFTGSLKLENASGINNALEFPSGHMISVGDTSGNWFFYGNRANNQNPFAVRSHVNDNDTRNDFWIDSYGTANFRDKVELHSTGTAGALTLPNLHMINTADNTLTMYPNRDISDNKIFRLRSHFNMSGYRDVFWLENDDRLYSPQWYSNTSSNSANVRVNIPSSAGHNGGTLYRVTSSRKYKLLEEEINFDPYQLLDVMPKTWYDKGNIERHAEELTRKSKGENYTADVEIGGLKRIAGLIAEDVVDAGLGMFVERDSNDEIQGIQYERLWTLLIPIVRDLKERLDNLERN